MNTWGLLGDGNDLLILILIILIILILVCYSFYKLGKQFLRLRTYNRVLFIGIILLFIGVIYLQYIL